MGNKSYPNWRNLGGNIRGLMSAETEGESRRPSNYRISQVKTNETNKIKELYRSIGEIAETEKNGM